MHSLIDVLTSFCNSSGLKVNFGKSRVMTSRNVNRHLKNALAQLSPVKFASDLERYLGFPLTQGHVKRSDFNFIMYCIQSRLEGWKGRMLNKAGRATLARIIISFIAICYMQNQLFPNAVCNSINKTIRNFIWGRGDSG